MVSPTSAPLLSARMPKHSSTVVLLYVISGKSTKLDKATAEDLY